MHFFLEGSYITYAAYPGEQRTIDCATASLPEWGGLIQLSEVAYVRISGLRVRDAGPHGNSAGILVGGCSHVIVEGNSTEITVFWTETADGDTIGRRSASGQRWARQHPREAQGDQKRPNVLQILAVRLSQEPPLL